ncbi:hypothetical protein [Methylobacterium komagatae]
MPEDTWWSYSYSPIHDGDCVAGVFCYTTETASRVLAERALSAANTQLRAQVADRTAERDLFASIVERTDIMVMACALDYTILAINRANADEFERIYGVFPRVGDNILDLLAGQHEHREQVRAG